MKPRPSQMKLLTDCLDLVPASVGNCVLAFSGGLDSCVLLHLLANSRFLPIIKLWHVHHGLQIEADKMASFCQQQASDYHLELKLSYLNLQTAKTNIEATARTARYALFAKELSLNDCLLTAHHLDDQVETFLLNVLRGSGSAGLRGIAAQKKIAKAQLIRPMLQFKRETLLDYATQHKLEWFEDPSNSSVQFNRNYIRHKLTPVIKQRWPNYQDSIGTVCDIQAETQQLLDDLAALDYVKLSNVSENLTLSTLSPTLNIEALDSLTKARQKNVIRYWLRVNKRSSLPKARLDTFIQQLGAKQGANPIIENNDYDIRLYDGRVFIVDHMMPQPLRSAYDFLAQPVLEVPELNLRLSRDSVLDYLGIKESGQVIQVRFRTEESPTHQNNHRLKRLFQTHKVAPWLRKITPQLIIDGELIGIWTT
ncbi:MAG: tRNA(Ile)-lysidine synthase [Gammaproteobacteria bacterium]|jgi:tRNA(Ile)-lysidine synthase